MTGFVIITIEALNKMHEKLAFGKLSSFQKIWVNAVAFTNIWFHFVFVFGGFGVEASVFLVQL